MAESVEAGAGLAWRLLATLEVGSLVVATSALVAYTTKFKFITSTQHRKINSVLVTNSTNALGKELVRRLVAQGCAVHTMPNNPTSAADKVDCLVVIGADSQDGLDGISRLVSQDVYENLNLLDSLAAQVKRSGFIVWTCSGATPGTYGKATSAFDTILQASLQHIAKNSHCEPIWIGRCESVQRAVDKVIASLFPCTISHEQNFSLRNAAQKVSEFLSRWLKMTT